MNMAASIEVRTSRRPRITRKLALALLFAVLLFRAGQFAFAGAAAVSYPWELDYGEGIVWQQARLIFTHKAYGPIDQWPAIVFHYTPLYHALTELTSRVLGTDELATGRAISLLCTLLAAVAAGLIASTLVERPAGRSDRRVVGCVAALLVFTFVPVTVWAPLMRVDMLALALSLLGLLAAMKAVDRPRLVYLASAAFVGAVYTKQVAVAAPLAAFAVLLATRPRLALQGIGACIALGSAALIVLTWITDGGFFRHIFLYNVNRSDLGRLLWILYAAATHALYVAIACWVAAQRGANLRNRYRSFKSLRGAAPGDVRTMIVLAYLAVTTVMLLMVAKSGSSINYFLEWCFAIAILAGTAVQKMPARAAAVSDSQKALAIAIPFGLLLQAAITAGSPFDTDPNGRRAREMAVLSNQVAAAQKPVISDDMVLLLRSGREVVWEPAIFAELGSTGVWDERPFVDRIRNGEFAFFVTAGKRGGNLFDQRYNPVVASAMDEAYPATDKLAGLTIHRPRNKADKR